mmetsp:Transcript_91041/g.195200  ORF Transcript_91041/g.195200 Transcript_91041/m.195200 type:complete len:227 (+) Transcript_91041:946-1626(+)
MNRISRGHFAKVSPTPSPRSTSSTRFVRRPKYRVSMRATPTPEAPAPTMRTSSGLEWLRFLGRITMLSSGWRMCSMFSICNSTSSLSARSGSRRSASLNISMGAWNAVLAGFSTPLVFIAFTKGRNSALPLINAAFANAERSPASTERSPSGASASSAMDPAPAKSFSFSSNCSARTKAAASAVGNSFCFFSGGGTAAAWSHEVAGIAPCEVDMPAPNRRQKPNSA